MTAPLFPTTIDAITPAWLTDVLREGGHLKDGLVSQVAAVPIGEGSGILSLLARLTLTYDKAGATGPATLVAKVPTDTPNRRMATAVGAYPREVGYYREMAARSPLRAPRCYAATLDPDSGDFILLLEDLSAARTVDPVVGCTPADAEAVIDALSKLHAAWWNHPRLTELTWLRAADDPRVHRSLVAFHRDRWPHFLERFGESVPDAARITGTALMDRVEEVEVCLERSGATVCHGDLRLDNLFFALPDTPVAAIDWQFCSRAGGIRDVTDFLIFNLDVTTRRAHERDLLGRYHQSLRAAGVSSYDFDRCLEDYRWAMLHWYRRAVATATADPGNARGEALFASFRERCFAANMDWDTGALLKG